MASPTPDVVVVIDLVHGSVAVCGTKSSGSAPAAQLIRGSRAGDECGFHEPEHLKPPRCCYCTGAPTGGSDRVSGLNISTARRHETVGLPFEREDEDVRATVDDRPTGRPRWLVASLIKSIGGSQLPCELEVGGAVERRAVRVALAEV